MKTLIFNYFPELNRQQQDKIGALEELYNQWNSKINVISRKDIDNIYIHHVLHSLAIAKVLKPSPETKILDIGTGGGFPGIPLAILYPQAHFTLCDSIAKKTTVAKSIAEELSLTNVTTVTQRAEAINGKFDFVVSRAVTTFKRFIPWVWDKITPSSSNSNHNGIYYLKGANPADEIAEAAKLMKIDSGRFIEYPISDWFSQDFFNKKSIIYIKR